MSNESLNVVAFRRGYFVEPGMGASGPGNELIVASLQAELMKLGFMLDADLYAHLKRSAPVQVSRYYSEILPIAREMVGAKRDYRPFYVNFPQQVMDLSAFELFATAMRHYWSNGTWEPQQDLAARGVSFENTEFRPIKLTTEDKFKNLFTKLVSVNTALTPADRELVEWFVKKYDDLPMPAAVPFKETLCLLASFGVDVPVKTTTDVLRIATFVSGGDISLPSVPKIPHGESSKAMVKVRTGAVEEGWGWAYRNRHEAAVAAREKFKFAHLRRSSRRYLLGLLEKTNLDTAEMQPRLERWLRLAEVLHPGEYRKQFPKTFAAFQALRNQPPRIRSYNSQVNLAFANNDVNGALALLAKKPGELARRIDWLMRRYELSEDIDQVLETFERVVPKISSKVLFELYDHLQRRLKSAPRSVSLKQRSKVCVLKELPPLKTELVTRVQRAIQDALRASMRQLPPLGTVWIDERLKGIGLPVSMRNMNTAVKTYIRGTRIPFRAEATTIRPFIHWHDARGREDLDLSAGFHSEDWCSIDHVSYTHLKSEQLNACHSGDVRHRRGSCAEYVDVDIERAREQGVRYVTVQVFNYNARPLHTVPECWFGLMERESPESNEIFDPKTISNAAALANESTSLLICAIDLEDKCYIWLDAEMNRAEAFYENTQSQVLMILKAVVDSGRLSVYNLLAMHAEARGVLVDDENAETTFRWEDFVTDYAKVASLMTF